MSEDETTETGETTDEGGGDPSALRTKLEKALKENRQLKEERRHSAYEDAGVPDGAFDVFDEMYDGALDAESIRDFGQSKGFALADLGGDGQGDTAVTETEAQQRAGGEQRLQNVQAGAIPPQDPSLQDEIAKAEEEGDFQTANRLKVQQLNQARNRS